MVKGQAEIIIIMGVLVMVIVVVFLVASGPGIVPGTSTKYQSVRDSVTNLIRSSASEGLRTYSLYGGYPEAQPGSTRFLDQDVSFWQQGGRTTTPQAKITFVQSVEDIITANKDSFLSGFAGNMVVGDARVTATFLNDQIALRVNLPITMNGEAVPSLYDVIIPTKFGEILDFAQSFSSQQAENRYLEYFILASLVASPYENGAPITPFLIYLTQCGDFLFKSSYELTPAVEDRVAVTLAHTYMPEKAPLNIGDVTPFPKYLIPPLGGKSYNDLDISFHLPDDFSLDPTTFSFTPNPIIAVGTPVSFTGICASEPIVVKYSLNVPVIVRAKDPLTGQVFQFANQVFLKSNAPGAWNDPSLDGQDLQALLCSSPACPARISVLDTSGDPIANADINFLGCSAGQSDNAGLFEGNVPCGAGPLEIAKPGYAISRNSYSFTNLTSHTTILVKNLNPTAFVYQATISNNTFTGEYWVDDIRALESDKKLLLTFSSLTRSGVVPIMRVVDRFSETVPMIPEDFYFVSGQLMSDDLQILYGSFELFASLTDGLDALHIVVPNSYDVVQSIDQTFISTAAVIHSSVLSHCNLGPLSKTAIDNSSVPCIQGYGAI